MKFYNPICDKDSPDPFMTYCARTGYYYAMATRGNRLEILRSRHAGNIMTEGESAVVFNAGENGIIDSIWAPEMHLAPNGKFYIYTSGRTDENDHTKHLFVMESKTHDPFDGFVFKGILDDKMFAIDPTVHTLQDGRQLICYSRVRGDGAQVLDIAELTSPYVLSKRRTEISQPDFDWELVPPYDRYPINEGAFFVENNGRLFIFYSANGCWSDNYCLGVLEYTGGDVLDKQNWVKHDKPILTFGEDLFGPGHASFFRSPDGSEIWCAFHALTESDPKSKPRPRFMCLQKMQFDETGYPVPMKVKPRRELIDPPKGEII